MTIKGCAAFSKSLCVLYMHVWYTEFCGNCPLFSRVIPLYDCPSLHYQVSQNSDFWLSMPAVFSFSRDRSSYPLSFSSILERQENLCGSRCIRFKQWFTVLTPIKIQHPFPHEHCFGGYPLSYTYYS